MNFNKVGSCTRCKMSGLLDVASHSSAVKLSNFQRFEFYKLESTSYSTCIVTLRDSLRKYHVHVSSNRYTTGFCALDIMLCKSSVWDFGFALLATGLMACFWLYWWYMFQFLNQRNKADAFEAIQNQIGRLSFIELNCNLFLCSGLHRLRLYNSNIKPFEDFGN